MVPVIEALHNPSIPNGYSYTYIMCGCHNVDMHGVGLKLTLNIIAIL